MPIESVMLSNHLILFCPFLLSPSMFPSIRVFFNGSALRIRQPNFGASASASALSMNIQGWFPLGLTGLIYLLSKRLSRVFSSTIIQKDQFFSAQLSLQSNSHIHPWLLENHSFYKIVLTILCLLHFHMNVLCMYICIMISARSSNKTSIRNVLNLFWWTYITMLILLIQKTWISIHLFTFF